MNLYFFYLRLNLLDNYLNKLTFDKPSLTIYKHFIFLHFLQISLYNANIEFITKSFNFYLIAFCKE